jgi:sigma-E factor negative regulatory protein RseC
MLETRAVIIGIQRGRALVQAESGSGCEHCSGKGCGSTRLAQLFCSTPRLFQVENRIDADVGDHVVISVEDGAVLRGIGLVYLLPLFLLFAGAVAANFLSSQSEHGDLYSAAGAIMGLALGFALARWMSSRYAVSRFRPYIARRWQE